MRSHVIALGRPLLVAFVALFLLVGAVAAGGAMFGTVGTISTPSGNGSPSAAQTNEPEASDDNGVDASPEASDDNGVDASAEPSESPEATNDDGAGHDADDDNGDDRATHDVNDDHGDDGANHDVNDDHGGDQATSGPSSAPEANDDNGGSSLPGENSGPGGG